MPKISDEKRASRRQQILNAAWACFERQGLHESTMRDVIEASKLSAGAVYSYFENKEELIHAALTTWPTEMIALAQGVFRRVPLPRPEVLVREIATLLGSYAKEKGFDLNRLILLGWGEAQRNPKLREALGGYYSTLRSQLAEAARAWRQLGLLPESAKPDDVAATLLALLLGGVAQSAILGGVETDALVRGVQQLTGGVPQPGRNTAKKATRAASTGDQQNLFGDFA